MKPPITEPAVVLARLRNWKASPTHSPYPGMLHSVEDDSRVDWRDAVLKILWRLPEGSRVSIDVTYELPENGDVDPEDVWELLAPNHYGHRRTRKEKEDGK